MLTHAPVVTVGQGVPLFVAGVVVVFGLDVVVWGFEDVVDGGVVVVTGGGGGVVVVVGDGESLDTGTFAAAGCTLAAVVPDEHAASTAAVAKPATATRIFFTPEPPNLPVDFYTA